MMLWTALIGGAVLLVLNLVADVPSGALWLTAPLSAILLVARSIYARRHTAPRP
jgi:hypothetical protein